MSSSNTTNDVLNALTAIYATIRLFGQYWSIIMIIIGFIGHTFNVIICTRPRLWPNPCVRYLFAATISGYMIVFFLLPIRMIQTSYGINLFIISVSMCKFLLFIFSWFR